MKIKFGKDKLPWLGFLLLIPSLLLNLFFYQKSRNSLNSQTGILVLEVLDGDTLLLDGDVRLRLRHTDAPELAYCGGSEAKDLLTNLAKGKRVVIQEEILDQYGRPMALAYQGETLLNLEMLQSGWARYHSDTTSQEKVLKQAADTAKKAGLGIFGPECYQQNPPDPKCNIKGNVDKNSTDRLYYLPNCAQYNFTIVEKDLGEDWFCTESEAKAAGFTKAATCH